MCVCHKILTTAPLSFNFNRSVGRCSVTGAAIMMLESRSVCLCLLCLCDILVCYCNVVVDIIYLCCSGLCVRVEVAPFNSRWRLRE